MRIGGYSPATSHFWCGQHCVVAAGCEEGLICACVKFNEKHKEIMSPDEAETKLWKLVVSQLRESGFSDLTVEELQQQKYEIRVAYTDFGSELFCGTFPRYNQFGTVPPKDAEVKK
ncbi:MAG: hypothetical protein HY980_01780 [Candidatus Magasanikbacteria bacterium]|nr:hypothetical protein [Candidatus Magasanikbacteria bacterium]